MEQQDGRNLGLNYFVRAQLSPSLICLPVDHYERTDTIVSCLSIEFGGPFLTSTLTYMVFIPCDSKPPF